MIVYEVQSKCFLLRGKNYSYYMYINRAGLLQHLYYGKRIGKGDEAFLLKTQGENVEPALNDLN